MYILVILNKTLAVGRRVSVLGEVCKLYIRKRSKG